MRLAEMNLFESTRFGMAVVGIATFGTLVQTDVWIAIALALLFMGVYWLSFRAHP